MTAPETLSAEAITKASKSNLALALIALPRERRRDMTTFYAFCRIVDDIADEPSVPAENKRVQLDTWRRAVGEEFSGEPPLAHEVRALIAKYRIDTNLFREVIAGCEMDLGGARYETFEDLRLYCYRVASAVGLVSIEVFGYKNPACKKYALDLGMALQLTNILRDVGQDFENGGRVYLPLEDLRRFGFSPDDLAGKANDENFRALMEFETERALTFYGSAVASLPREDRKSMIAAEIMREVYGRMLARMRSEGFRVFEKRYSLSKLEKTAIVARVLARNFFE
jgi:phytoene synthase